MSGKFLSSSNLSGLFLLADEEQPLLFQYNDAIGRVLKKVPDLQHFFAEPVVTRNRFGGPESAKWYTEFDLEARRLTQLEGAAKDVAIKKFTQKIKIAAGWLDDPEIGNVLLSMLSIPSLDSVYFLGTNPVLINWATLNDESERDHLLERLQLLYGDYGIGIIDSDLPESNSIETTQGAVNKNVVNNPRAVANLIAEDIPSEDSAEITGHDFRQDGTSRSENLGSADFDAENSQIVAKEVAYLDETPFYHRSWFRWILYAILMAGILFLLWLILFCRPYGLLVRPENMGLVHQQVLEGLEAERNRIEGLLQEPCQPEAAEAIEGGYTGPVIPRAMGTGGPSVPQGPDAQDGTDELADSTESDLGQSQESLSDPIDLSLLAKRMERSAAFVFGAVPSGGVSMGSGFFIANNMIVTNRHVIEGADPNRLAVTSSHLGKVHKVRIVGQTPSSNVGEADFAVLQLDEPANVQPVPLSPVVEKLGRVVAVGYPGYLTSMDPSLDALLLGDISASPEMVFTSGEVSVVQQYENSPSIIIHTADMSQGNSGGPLVDQCGRVVGINTFIGMDQQSGRRGLFSLGASALAAFLGQQHVSYQESKGACRAVTDEPIPVAGAEPVEAPEVQSNDEEG